MRRHILSLYAVLAISLCLSQAATASPRTYVVNESVGAGSVTGTITTDGTTGVLFDTNVLSWDLSLSDGTSSIVLTPSNSIDTSLSSGWISATPNALTFDFAGAGYASFGQTGPTGSSVCWSVSSIVCNVSGQTAPGVYIEIGGTDPNYQFAAPSSFALSGTVLTVAVPEPASGLLLTPVLAALGLIRRRAARTIEG